VADRLRLLGPPPAVAPDMARGRAVGAAARPVEPRRAQPPGRQLGRRGRPGDHRQPVQSRQRRPQAARCRALAGDALLPRGWGESGALRRAAALLQQGLSAEAVGKARSASRHERPIGCIQSMARRHGHKKDTRRQIWPLHDCPQDPSRGWEGGRIGPHAGCRDCFRRRPRCCLRDCVSRGQTTSDRKNGSIRECCNRPLDLWSRRWSSP
jgi:hypothetical protein